MINITDNNELLKKHVDNLNSSLIERIDNIVSVGYIIKDKNKIFINPYIKDCLNYIKTKIQSILNANTKEMKKIIEYFNANYPCLTKKYEYKESKPAIYLIIYNIFVSSGYDSYLSKVYEDDNKINEKEYHAYKLVKELELKTCPYCNINYISFVKTKEKQLRPELDHYYPKSIYPFLACSFYNLIPSCSSCNHMKSDDDSYKDEKCGELINPYNINKGDFTFSYKLNDLKLNEITSTKELNFEYENSIEIEINTKYKQNLEYFKLEEVYKNHKDIVIELILKEINYPRSYIDELISNGFGTEEEIYRFLFSNYLEEDSLHKRPLSKLTKDIVNELGMIEKIKLLINKKKDN